MLFWSMTIGFVVWVVAVVIEVIWFWGPTEDQELGASSQAIESNAIASPPEMEQVHDVSTGSELSAEMRKASV